MSQKLSEMGHDLSGVIEEINSVSSALSSSSKVDDPVCICESDATFEIANT